MDGVVVVMRCGAEEDTAALGSTHVPGEQCGKHPHP